MGRGRGAPIGWKFGGREGVGVAWIFCESLRYEMRFFFALFRFYRILVLLDRIWFPSVFWRLKGILIIGRVI